jgi:hypothetical protein
MIKMIDVTVKQGNDKINKNKNKPRYSIMELTNLIMRE